MGIIINGSVNIFGGRTSIYKLSNVVSSYTIEADALFTRMATAGDEPDDTRKDKINDLFVNLKADGLLSKHDALWIPASHSSIVATLNWVGSNYTLSPTNEPTFTIDEGYTGNAVDKYIKTGYIPSNGDNYTDTDACMWIYIRNDVNEIQYVMGCKLVALGRYTVILPYYNGNMTGIN